MFILDWIYDLVVTVSFIISGASILATLTPYEKDDELFSDRNVFPRGCVLKMEKVTL